MSLTICIFSLCSLGLADSALLVPMLETHKVHFGDSHLGSVEGLPFFLGAVYCSLPKNSVCRSTTHTNSLFDALLQSVFPCTSQKITLFFLYSAGRYNTTESLAIMLVNNLRFKCSLGMPESK